jgi:hypothetical protein
MMTTQRLLLGVITAGAMGLASPLLAQDDCTATKLEAGPTFTTGPDCTISWIDNAEMRSLTWQAVTDDYQPATLVQTGKGTTLTSSQLPELIDVDQDGWLDIVTFTSIGMVNGTFDIFLYDPAGGGYRQGRSVSGFALSQDRDGYLVVASKDGPATLTRFFKADPQGLQFQFEINPYATDPAKPEGGFTCDIRATRSDGSAGAAAGVVPENPDLLSYYCDPQPAPSRARRDTDLTENPATTDRVPGGTLFYCRLEGGTRSVTISETAKGLRYTYGPLRGTPELVLDRAMREVTILPAKGPDRSGAISFKNAAYTYTVSYGDKMSDAGGAAGTAKVKRGLVVTKDGNADRPIFAKACLSDHTYDAITTLHQR